MNEISYRPSVVFWFWVNMVMLIGLVFFFNFFVSVLFAFTMMIFGFFAGLYLAESREQSNE